jgi:hypothetical protein
VNAISVAVCERVQSFSGSVSMSRKPAFARCAPGAIGTRNDAPPRLLSRLWIAYS